MKIYSGLSRTKELETKTIISTGALMAKGTKETKQSMEISPRFAHRFGCQGPPMFSTEVY